MLTQEQLARALRSGRPDLLNLVAAYLDARDTEQAATNFRAFVKLFWHIVAPNPLVDGWYLDAICEHLQALPTLKRLLINVPPRCAKSSLCCVLYPAWLWINRPETKFLCSSYSLKSISERDSVRCRAVIESPQYQRRWQIKLAQDQNTKTRFRNDRQGERISTSIDSGNTGEGCDILIADDLNDVNRAGSEADRLSVIHWWSQVMSTRMNPGGLDCKVVIQQRCHEEDITGFILRSGEDWTHLVLPWEYEPKRRCTTALPWQDPRTQEGEPLSKHYSPDKITELKGGNGLGPTGFACQFQQRPAPAEGATFKGNWFSRYHETADAFMLGSVTIPKAVCRQFIVTDLAISLKQTADWTIGQAWSLTPHGHMLLREEWRERVEGPDTIRQFRRLANIYHPDAVYVEDVAYQRLMLQLLRQEGLPTKALAHHGLDKKARCQRSIVKAECGQVWLPQGDWDEWLNEVCSFPNGRHDDRVDCLAWAGIVAAKYGVKPLEAALPEPKDDHVGPRALPLPDTNRAELMWTGLD